MKTVAVRYDNTKLHFALAVGTTYIGACGTTLTGIAGRDVFVYTGRDRMRAWVLEDRCMRCNNKAAKAGSLRALAKACNW